MAVSRPLKIGTRESELATWQAKTVAAKLEKLGHRTTLHFIKSEGDQDLTTPLHQMGGKGVFTKALDDALMNGEIDLAVHSFKDLPTEQPLPLKVVAVLEREDPRDAFVASDGMEFLKQDIEVTIATSSTRRRAQWLSRYPNHTIANIRGNVNTRLRKVQEQLWKGAIFAAAGLKRINLEHHISAYLDWMVPAPAQGAMAVMTRDDDTEVMKAVRPLNDTVTERCTGIERDLLHDLEAGCSAPVGAYARLQGNEIVLQAVALMPDGSERFDFEASVAYDDADAFGHRAAEDLLKQGAEKVIAEIKK